MNAGKLRHYVQLQNYTITRNDAGSIVKVWVTFASVWAKITDISGSTIKSAQQEDSETTHTIQIRYNQTITKLDRIVYKTDTYEILSVVNDDTRKTHQLIKAKSIYPSVATITVVPSFTVTIFGQSDGNWDDQVIPVILSNRTFIITKVTAAAIGRGSLVFNLEKRNKITLSTVGTEILSSDLTADEDSVETTSFASASVLSDQYIVFVTGTGAEIIETVEQVTITVQYQFT